MLPLGNKTGHLPLRYYKAHLKNCTYGCYQAHHTIQLIHNRRFQDQGKTVIKTLETHSPTSGQEDPRQDPPTHYTCPADYSSHTWSVTSVCLLPNTTIHCAPLCDWAWDTQKRKESEGGKGFQQPERLHGKEKGSWICGRFVDLGHALQETQPRLTCCLYSVGRSFPVSVRYTGHTQHLLHKCNSSPTRSSYLQKKRVLREQNLPSLI